ncbi:ATP-dependent nuclease subunit A, partial [gut metagenome]
PKNPVDLDRLLIMTFTRAAAGEMRERIAKALEQALYEDPDNEHLQRQTTLIHGAQITTIDGFCAYILRNYFHLIDLDPGYRTGDEGELKLIKEDVLSELLEEEYQKQEEDFQQFVECYAPGKSDEGLKDWILKVYEAAMSHPDPEKWLEESLSSYEEKTPEEFFDQPWMKLVWKTAAEELFQAQSLLEEGKLLCGQVDGPGHYEEALDSDLLLVRDLQETVKEQDYDKMAVLL